MTMTPAGQAVFDELDDRSLLNGVNDADLIEEICEAVAQVALKTACAQIGWTFDTEVPYTVHTHDLLLPVVQASVQWQTAHAKCQAVFVKTTAVHSP